MRPFEAKSSRTIHYWGLRTQVKRPKGQKHHCSALRKTFKSDSESGFSTESPEIRRLHGEVHVLAKVLCERKQMGNTGQLEDGRAELRALSDALLTGIRALVLECASEEARRGVGVAS